MQRAIFSKTLAEQIYSFNSLGYVLIRQAPENYVNDITALAVAKEYILQRFARKQDSWSYNLWRMFNKVATSDNRHSLVLPSNVAIMNVLNSTIGSIKPFLNSQLSGDSSMVELNSLISLPGSLQQDVHADIPYSDDNLLISGYIALSDVTLDDGPTCLHGGSHTQSFHNQIYTKPLDSYYNSDGSIDETYLHQDKGNALLEEQNKENTIKSLNLPIHYAQLKAGDILLFNTMVFHYGSANTSLLPRALLSFSFQRNNDSGLMEPINGFTYHCHSSVSGKYTLDNFPDTTISHPCV